MTPEEIAAAQEARAVEAHAKYLATCDAYMLSLTEGKTWADAAALRGDRIVISHEAQTRTNQSVADELPRSQRLAMLMDSATARVTDRTAAGGAADVPKAVTEALALMAEVEFRSTPPILPPPPPAPDPNPAPPGAPPKPPGV